MRSGSELPQHLFPSRILIILHLSTLQGANGVIMLQRGEQPLLGREAYAPPSRRRPRGMLRPLPWLSAASATCRRSTDNGGLQKGGRFRQGLVRQGL